MFPAEDKDPSKVQSIPWLLMTLRTRKRTLSSLVAPQVVITVTYGTNGVVKVVKLMTFCFQWRKERGIKSHGLGIISPKYHYGDVIMGAIASQITSLTIVYSTVNSDADQRKHQSSASLAFVWGISPGTGEFPAQMASYAENVSIWWRHHAEIYRPNHQGHLSLTWF